MKICCSVGALHARCYSSSSSTKAAAGVHPAGRQRDGSRRVLNRDDREDEEDQPITLLHLAPLCAEWCAFWRCHAVRELDSSSCLAEPFEFVVLTLLTTAHIVVNWLWLLSSRIPPTRFLYCPRSRCRGSSAPAEFVTHVLFTATYKDGPSFWVSIYAVFTIYAFQMFMNLLSDWSLPQLEIQSSPSAQYIRSQNPLLCIAAVLNGRDWFERRWSWWRWTVSLWVWKARNFTRRHINP